MKLVIIELPSGCVPRNTSCTYFTYHTITLKRWRGQLVYWLCVYSS